MSTFSTFPRICSYCNLLPHNNFLHWRPIHISLIARNCRRLISKWIICCDWEYLRYLQQRDATVFKSLAIIRMQAVQRLMNDSARPWWNYAPGLKYLKCWFICANVYFPSRRISTVIYRNTTHIPKKISTPIYIGTYWYTRKKGGQQWKNNFESQSCHWLMSLILSPIPTILLDTCKMD